MKIDDIKNITSSQDVNEILVILCNGLKNILGDQLVGLYLTGSLTYGDFDAGRSDIDFLVVLREALTHMHRKQVKNMHEQIAKNYPEWAERIEGSYITTAMLHSIDPPKIPRPYVNGGHLWDPDPTYGHEWLLNLFVLYDCGIALVGPDPKILIGHPINIEEVRMASKNDFFQEWKPLLKDPIKLKDDHFQAYAILTLCRILYREKNDNVVSKRIASAWVRKTYGKQWGNLIKKAENWQYGQEMDSVDNTLKFIKFVLKKIK